MVAPTNHASIFICLFVFPLLAHTHPLNCNATAVMGGGCFWGIEAALQKMIGVCQVQSGYAGGLEKDPKYADVKAQRTSHAEVVRVSFDESVIPYEVLVKAFMRIHDPTSVDRQGVDEGRQYRSIILYESDKQAETIAKVLKQLQPEYKKKIVTEIKLLQKFYPAEECHQDYFTFHPDSECAHEMPPKLQALKDLLKQ